MRYGITGNPEKDTLWVPVAALVQRLRADGLPFRLHTALAEGLFTRGLLGAESATAAGTDDPADGADVLLSFGGDGSLLRAAHLVGARGVPILGVNVGRLGFLANVETEAIEAAVEALEADAFGVQERMTLAVDFDGADRLAPDLPRWALNDFVIDKSGTTSMIAVEAHVDGRYLNTYWADGLVVATPTGSTAYSLAAGGPILMPGSGVLVVTPIAPHTLTARPIVLAQSVTLALRVATRGHPYVLACDGYSAEIPAPDGDAPDVTFTIRRAAHTIRLVTLAGSDYFATIRTKLMWGQAAVF